MNDMSNKTLALLLVTAIVVSLGATVFTLTKLEGVTITGQVATPSSGNVSLTVETAESFILRVDQLDFGSGFVNTSELTIDGVTKCSNATLYAGFDYNDTNDGNCWTSFSGAPDEPGSGFQIENDGNVNLTLSVAAENSSSFFGVGEDLLELANLTFKSRDNTTGVESCIAGEVTKWTDFQDYGQVICSNLRYESDVTDDMAIDIRVIIPSSGLTAGTYENATIEFTGAEAS
jgi:hypothetical protein